MHFVHVIVMTFLYFDAINQTTKMQLVSFYELYSSLSFIHGTISRQMHVD